MRSEAARKTAWDVQELMNQSFLFVLFGHFVVYFRDNLDCVGRRYVEDTLPDFA